MNKKQKNRKLVTQNKRNRIINRRYTSTIKNLAKLIKTKFLLMKNDVSIKDEQRNEISTLINRFYSILDKATKKKVIHKNKAARKKSIFQNFYNKSIEKK